MPNKLFKSQPLLALAPMAGITDSAFRLLCRESGADLVYSEMVSADGLVYGKKSWELVKFSSRERPIVIQLFGKKPDKFAAAAAMIVRKIKPEAIDINMGCPAKKVVRSGHGVVLMQDPALACQIVQAVKKAVGDKCLVSVKTRLGFSNKKEILSFAPKLEKAGMDFLCLHGRTYPQGFSGEVDLLMIKKVKDLLKIPVLANGGVKTPEQAAAMLKVTGADGLALGLGTLGRPWLFQEIKEFLNTGAYRELTWSEIKKVMMRQAKLAYQQKGSFGLVELRKHLCWYTKGHAGAAEWRARLVRVETLRDIQKILKEI
ncbi:MAG: tRNA-dihydrouridine synthase [Patescibacteria group bacterium]|jgi:nifR3 family TIM-barrel protein